MVWWRKVILSVSSIILALTLGFIGLSLAFTELTSEQTMRALTLQIAADAGASADDASQRFDELYFRQFSCGTFLDCLANPPAEGLGAVLVSKTGNEFFRKSIAYVGILTLLAVVGILMATETWGVRLKAIGIPAIVAGLNVLIKPVTDFTVLKAVPQESAQYIVPLLDRIFSTVTLVSAVLLVAGIILTIAGVVIARKEAKATKPAPEATS